MSNSPDAIGQIVRLPEQRGGRWYPPEPMHIWVYPDSHHPDYPALWEAVALARQTGQEILLTVERDGTQRWIDPATEIQLLESVGPRIWMSAGTKYGERPLVERRGVSGAQLRLPPRRRVPERSVLEHQEQPDLNRLRDELRRRRERGVRPNPGAQPSTEARHRDDPPPQSSPAPSGSEVALDAEGYIVAKLDARTYEVRITEPGRGERLIVGRTIDLLESGVKRSGKPLAPGDRVRVWSRQDSSGQVRLEIVTRFPPRP